MSGFLVARLLNVAVAYTSLALFDTLIAPKAEAGQLVLCVALRIPHLLAFSVLRFPLLSVISYCPWGNPTT